jgi:AcrR family transcriptional regulator
MLGPGAVPGIRVCPGFHTVLHGVASWPAMSLPPARPLPLRRRTRASAPDAEGTRASLTPESWVEAATAVLVDQGIDHVRVDVLAGQLGVTRGSFYWHFRDREDLLRRVLQAWSEQTTEQLTRRLVTARTQPLEQLRDVISLPFRGRAAAKAARIELAIRAWARRDELARQAVDAADAARIGYHREIFAALGFAEADAEHRAFLLYGYEVAESLLHRQGTAALRQARAAYVERLMLQGLPQTA